MLAQLKNKMPLMSAESHQLKKNDGPVAQSVFDPSGSLAVSFVSPS